jgi:feruloyl esterase
MVATMVSDHGVDPTRVFVTGLSAGGAMTSVMLATYPDVFAGGAIIAGLPYGAAGYPRQVWVNAAGDELIESYTIPSMAHGTPLATGAANDQCGAAGPFLLEVGISSSYHIAKFFDLAAKRMAPESSPRPLGGCRVPEMPGDRDGAKTSEEPLEGEVLEPNFPRGSQHPPLDPDALKKAGLLKSG